LRNDVEYKCGWLYLIPKISMENTLKNAKKRQPTENEKNIKIEI